MNRKAAVTIIRSKGEGVQAVVNGVVDKEMARQREDYQRRLSSLTEKYTREIAKLKEEIAFLTCENTELKQHRNELLVQKYTRIPAKRNILAALVGVIR